MVGQMSIFDFIQDDDVDIEDMTTEQLAEKIGSSIGVKFVKGNFLDEYCFKKKKYTISVRKSHYQCDTYNRKEGDAFISCDFSYGNGGYASPIDSIDDAILFFRKIIDEYKIA